MWLPDVMTSTPEARIESAVEGVRPMPPATFSPLAVTKSIWRASRSSGQELLDGDSSGLADHVADHQDPARTRRPRRVAVRDVAQPGPAELSPIVSRCHASAARRASAMRLAGFSRLPHG